MPAQPGLEKNPTPERQMPQPEDSVFTCIIDHIMYAQNAFNFPET